MKALQKGVAQLCEEGATQVFRPLKNNDLILGAVGLLQFDVAAFRLKDEYGVDAVVEPISVQTARWVRCDNSTVLARFRDRAYENLAEDGDGLLVYLAPTRINLSLTQERWPEITFLATREL
jgi:peptide chain release factor 3